MKYLVAISFAIIVSLVIYVVRDKDSKTIKDLSVEITPFVDPALLPDQRELPDREKSHLLFKEIKENLPNTDLLADLIPNGDLAKYSSEEKQIFLNFASKHRSIQSKFLEFSTLECSVPDPGATPFVRSGIYNVSSILLTADAIKVNEGEFSSGEAAKLLTKHLKLGKALLSCKGNFVNSVISFAHLLNTINYIKYFVKKDFISENDSKSILDLTNTIPSDLSFIKEQIKLNYYYSYLWALDLLSESITASRGKPSYEYMTYVIGLGESVDAVNKYYTQIMLLVEAKQSVFENKYQLLWFTEYLTVESKDPVLNGLISQIYKTLNSGVGSLDVFNTMLSVAKNYPQLKNMVGKQVLKNAYGNDEKIIEALILDVLKFKAQAAAIAYLAWKKAGKASKSIKTANDLVKEKILPSMPQSDFSRHRFVLQLEKNKIGWEDPQNSKRNVFVDL